VKPEAIDSAQITEAIGALRQELARLSNRVAALEAAVEKHPEAVAPAENTGLSEELIAVIGAAIAAFLGKKAHIRQIRLLGAATWAQQGRATIQASHGLLVHHG
jgi:methylmalonyl-CoA carboxyltransferase large subunit